MKTTASRMPPTSWTYSVRTDVGCGWPTVNRLASSRAAFCSDDPPQPATRQAEQTTNRAPTRRCIPPFIRRCCRRCHIPRNAPDRDDRGAQAYPGRVIKVSCEACGWVAITSQPVNDVWREHEAGCPAFGGAVRHLPDLSPPRHRLLPTVNPCRHRPVRRQIAVT